MTRRPISFLPALAALLLAGAASGKTLKDFAETYPLESGGSISLENINGDIELSSWDRDEVEVRYRVTGDSEKALDRVKVKINADAAHLRIDTVHSKSKSWWGSGNSASVHYELIVPSDARLRSVETVNGSISIKGVRGEVDAETVNGGIEVTGLESDAKLSTVNGSVEATMERFGADQRVSLESVNGRIQVYIPDDADVEIRAETVHGSLRNDFGLPVEKGMVGRDLRGRLGDGGGRLSLDTVNGSISIRRR
ncbi:MAG: DUF4097 family beta strand repeat-containing protein [Pseudomonadota bacterium]